MSRASTLLAIFTVKEVGVPSLQMEPPRQIRLESGITDHFQGLTDFQVRLYTSYTRPLLRTFPHGSGYKAGPGPGLV